MPSDLIHTPSPLQTDLVARKAELAALRETLAEREQMLADLRNRLRTFEARYMAQIGTLYARLDDLEAQIAEREVTLYDSASARERAAAARARASETHEAAYGDERPVEAPEPTAALRTLFREVARRIHPDFAVDEPDAAHRTRLMSRANEAYARGDDDALRRLLDDHLETEGTGGAAESGQLERLDRQIAHAQRDVAALDRELAELPAGDIAEFKTDADAARLEGRDLLAELAADLLARIADAEHRLLFTERQVHAFGR